MFYGNRKTKTFLSIVFIFIIFILVVSSCISAQNITLQAYKNVRNKRMEETKSYSFSINKENGAVIDPGLKSQDTLSMDNLDESTFSILLLIIRNLSTLFSKLIIVLSFYQFLVYIRGWIILVSQVKFRFFVIRYLQLMDGEKSQFVFQS